MSNSTNPINKIIGTGLAAPIVFDDLHTDRLFLMAGGLSVINQSIHTIMSTRKGERYNNPNFGCDIKRRIFEPNDTILKTTLRFDVADALSKWEKRVTVTAIFVNNYEDRPELGDHLIYIVVNYMVNSTHTLGSYVYPFVLNAMPIAEIISKGI